MNVVNLLLHCAIRINLRRIENEKYDRNREIYNYFAGKKFKLKGQSKKVAQTVCGMPNKAGYVFDQYFGIILNNKPSPDAAELAKGVKEAWEKHDANTSAL